MSSCRFWRTLWAEAFLAAARNALGASRLALESADTLGAGSSARVLARSASRPRRRRATRSRPCRRQRPVARTRSSSPSRASVARPPVPARRPVRAAARPAATGKPVGNQQFAERRAFGPASRLSGTAQGACPARRSGPCPPLAPASISLPSLRPSWTSRSQPRSASSSARS